jgi:signal transduction histidine kinase/CheY-like chemotaxis protein
MDEAPGTGARARASAHAPEQLLLRVTDWFIPPHVLADCADAVRRARTIVLFCLVLEAWAPFFILAYRVLTPPETSTPLTWGIAVFSLANVAMLLLGRRWWRAHFAGLGVLSNLVCVLLFIVSLTGGADSPAAWWLAMVPMVAVAIGSRAHALTAVAISTAAFAALDLIGPSHPLPVHTRSIVESIAQVSLMTALFALALAYEASKEAAVGALARSNAALDDSRRGAIAASRAKSEFLANMSHEIRTPMSAIVGFAELLAEKNETEAEHAEAVEVIRRNGENLLKLINDILDLSKIEAGRVELRRERCSPVDLIADVVSLMRVRADARKLDLQVTWATLIPASIETDVTRARQVLINLVGNAIKFTVEGTVEVQTSFRRDAGSGPRLEIAVHDTGIGIAPEALERAFDPFTQVDASLSRRFGGTGLGLTICRRLAELLGAEVEAESQPGVGSTFRLSLPVDAADDVPLIDPSAQVGRAVAAPRPAPAASPLLQTACVLVAEDGADNQRLIAKRLTRAGVKLTMVENGALAVASALDAEARGEPFDLVLMDMQMPILDGYAATRTLRERGYRGFVVALTAHAMQGDRARCLDAGCDDYLAKPIDVGALLECVERCARESALIRGG